jgi:hypothetical protein
MFYDVGLIESPRGSILISTCRNAGAYFLFIIVSCYLYHYEKDSHTLSRRTRDYARSIGCYSITLNVWEGNVPASSFYKEMGMHVQKTTMEVLL